MYQLTRILGFTTVPLFSLRSRSPRFSSVVALVGPSGVTTRPLVSHEGQLVKSRS